MSRWEPSHLDAAARRLVAIAELDDTGVTGMMRQAVETTGGELVGIDHRVKTVESLARKLADLVRQDPDIGVEEAGSDAYDVLRYTVVADTERYMGVHDAVLGRLRAEGIEVVLATNRWAGPGYRGINIRLRDRDRRFEVQFHTRQSFEAARATRGHYEELRLNETPQERKDELQNTIDDVFSPVAVPPGAL
jgi:hypothetical protein